MKSMPRVVYWELSSRVSTLAALGCPSFNVANQSLAVIGFTRYTFAVTAISRMRDFRGRAPIFTQN